MGGQKKRKDRKTRKSRSEEKGVGFRSHPGGIDHPTRRRTQGAGIVSAFQIHSRKTRITGVRAP